MNFKTFWGFWVWNTYHTFAHRQLALHSTAFTTIFHGAFTVLIKTDGIRCISISADVKFHTLFWCPSFRKLSSIITERSLCYMYLLLKKSWTNPKWLICVSLTQGLINATSDPTHYKIILAKNITKLTLMNLTEEDSGKYMCSAIFDIKPSDSQLILKVLSFSEPLKPFVAIAVEVAILVTLILLYERQSQKKKGPFGTTGRLKR